MGFGRQREPWGDAMRSTDIPKSPNRWDLRALHPKDTQLVYKPWLDLPACECQNNTPTGGSQNRPYPIVDYRPASWPTPHPQKIKSAPSLTSQLRRTATNREPASWLSWRVLASCDGYWGRSSFWIAFPGVAWYIASVVYQDTSLAWGLPRLQIWVEFSRRWSRASCAILLYFSRLAAEVMPYQTS